MSRLPSSHLSTSIELVVQINRCLPFRQEQPNHLSRFELQLAILSKVEQPQFEIELELQPDWTNL